MLALLYPVSTTLLGTEYLVRNGKGGRGWWEALYFFLCCFYMLQRTFRNTGAAGFAFVKATKYFSTASKRLSSGRISKRLLK